jgi:catechol-2,3-dioxygenase
MNSPLEYKRWHDFDLHIALEVEENILLKYYNKGKDNNIETRGVSDHGFIKSIYFRDPNGYVIELTSPVKNYKKKHKKKAKDILNEWTLSKNE